MQLRAERVEGGWKLSGQKSWTTSAHFADYYWLGARTDPSSKHRGITLFLIPMAEPGLSIRPVHTISRYTVVDTIGGCASEIQKNIIALRGLGLPRP